MPSVADQLSSLLRIKVATPPRTRGIVARTRLNAVLDRADDARLILVSAPPGFGKSTLLAEWIKSSGVRSVWLSLDRDDNDVVRFVGCLAAAAAQLAGRPFEVDLLTAAQPFDAALALAPVLDVLSEASSGGRVVIVLDDYHVIDQSAIHRLVAALVARLPPGARLAIATRADPPLPLARLRANGGLLEIRADDLAFRPAEAAELLRESGLDLRHDQVEELTKRTEGWAAMLRLAAVALHARGDHEDLVHGFAATHRFVLDYVVEEVLAGLPAPTHDFLLRTSVLDRLSGPLCDAVTGEQDGQACLEALEHMNLLIVPLDQERHSYRYHALFAEVLRNRLGILHPNEVAQLHRRAFAWYEERGRSDEAIDHAIRSGDAGLASGVVGEAALRYLNAGQLSLVRRWLDALPPQVVRTEPQLSASYAWCLLLGGETAGVAERVADCEATRSASADGGAASDPLLRPELALLRAGLAARQGDRTTAVENARLALSLVSPALAPDLQALVCGHASVLLADALLEAGDTDAAMAAYEAALPNLSSSGAAFGAAHVVASLAEIDLRNGRPSRALERCESHLQAAGGDMRVVDGPVWIAMGHSLAELGDLERGTETTRQGLELASRGGNRPAARVARRLLEAIAGRQRRGTRNGTPIVVESVDALTPREIEVLRLVALGCSNRQIATRLFLAVGTVKSHLHSLSEKLGATNRVEAVARGRELGILG